MDFSRRATTAEWMDNEACGFEEFRACLRDLAKVNRLTRAYRPTLAWLERLLAAGVLKPREEPWRIVDIGSGYGDLPRQVDAWAARRGIAVQLTGVDMNPWSAKAAAEATAPGRPIRWVTANAFSFEPEGQIDFVVSSLFAHHLPDDGVARFLGWMEGVARWGWFINDLRRHPVSYHGFRTWARLARWHRFVRHDGPVSIARGFTEDDWRRLASSAGLAFGDVELERWVPFRLCVSRVKEER